jgi:ABC-type multidrug transport system ATPase subunit
VNTKTLWLIGSHPDCDLVVDDPHVSGRHCQLTQTAQGFQLVDLKSTNGTYVNGTRLIAPVLVRPTDQITLGYSAAMPWPKHGAPAAIRQTAVQAIPNVRPQAAPSRSPPENTAPLRGQMTIEARGVSVDVPGRRLLENVSLTIRPKEFVGLMGPSGAGKTTLMSALNGYSPPSEGLVLVNGQNLYEHFAQFADRLGYVPQDDIMHRELTVGQALYYTARLRLPPDTTDAEIHARIMSVLAQLGLEGTINTLIGSPERKGISGGQRKRVNLAMELLTDPAVLFLDEPTSGLSSEDALTVMTLLRKLADSGKSILLTIHQPSLEAYRLLDNVVIISKDSQSSEPGRLVFYGPAYPDAVQFFNAEKAAWATETSPDELLRGLARQPTGHWHERYERSKYHRAFVAERANKNFAGVQTETLEPAGRVSILQQWVTLVRRSLSIKIADRWNTAILLAQAPVVALAVVLVFGGEASRKITVETWQQVNSATGVTVFLLGLSALWFGCSNSVREIVGEWAIYQRERMVNLRIPAYVFSKLAVSALLCLIQCAVLIGAARWGSSLRAPLVSSFLVMLLVACTGIGIGLIMSAVARTSEVAIAMLPLTLIPMVIFGGILLPVYKMKSAPIKALAYAMPSRSGFEAMMLQESSRRPLGPSPYSGTIARATTQDDPDRPDMSEVYFPRNDRLGISTSVTILAAMFLTTVIAIHIILRVRDVR